jgi:hypothetical protein
VTDTGYFPSCFLNFLYGDEIIQNFEAKAEVQDKIKEQRSKRPEDQRMKIGILSSTKNYDRIKSI